MDDGLTICYVLRKLHKFHDLTAITRFALSSHLLPCVQDNVILTHLTFRIMICIENLKNLKTLSSSVLTLKR